jgi:multicomponent Na+:H+ antiporter subunit B
MKSLIFATASKYLLPLLLLFSFFLLLRGHNEPGGGFVGGLIASSAFAVYAIANGVKHARDIISISPGNFISSGLALALGAGLMPLLVGKNFMTGLWSDYEIPVIGYLSTPLLFDIGVYFVVLGVALTIIFTLAEE